jgi:hypothetical protein
LPTTDEKQPGLLYDYDVWNRKIFSLAFWLLVVCRSLPNSDSNAICSRNSNKIIKLFKSIIGKWISMPLEYWPLVLIFPLLLISQIIQNVYIKLIWDSNNLPVAAKRFESVAVGLRWISRWFLWCLDGSP